MGIILYILYINPVGFPAEATIKISDVVHDYWEVLDNVPEIQPNDDSLPTTVQSIKFLDDATLQEAVNLTSELATHKDRSGPLPFWELGLKQSCGKVLPKNNSLLQNQIETIKDLSDCREMALNTDNTCLFIVNFILKHQVLLQDYSTQRNLSMSNM